MSELDKKSRSERDICTKFITPALLAAALAEQRRIVAKVGELMAAPDVLESMLTTTRTTAEKLLAATTAKLAVSPSNPLHAA